MTILEKLENELRHPTYQQGGRLGEKSADLLLSRLQVHRDQKSFPQD